MRDMLLAGRALPGTFVHALSTVADYAATNRLMFYRDGKRKEAEAVSITAVNPTTNEAPDCNIKVLINAGTTVHATIAGMMADTTTSQKWFMWNPKNQGPLNLTFHDRKSANGSGYVATIDFLPTTYGAFAAAITDIFFVAAER